MKIIRWRYPLAICLAAIVLLSRDGLALGRMGLVAAVLHELGHIIAYYSMMGRLPRLEISPLGIKMEVPGSCFSPKELLILTAAGPGMNLAIGLLVLLAMQVRASYLGYWFAGVNLLLGGFNLLPFGCLDGKRLITEVRNLQKTF